MEKKKKCTQILPLPPGTLADMLYLRVVFLFCAASARRRRESSPKADRGRLLFLCGKQIPKRQSFFRAELASLSSLDCGHKTRQALIVRVDDWGGDDNW